MGDAERREKQRSSWGGQAGKARLGKRVYRWETRRI
jgi:hypothetical protein